MPIDPSTTGGSQHGCSVGAGGDDAASEVAPSELLGRGSRLSMRHEFNNSWEVATEDGGDSRKGTLKGMFKKQKKSKQIELDALRCVLS